MFSDIGGYAVGVKFGRHPMAPSLSPKKSWEGFAGSVLSCAAVGAISLPVVLGGLWWAGALLGVAAAAGATVGDLIESSIKRDLGIKDMGALLPGHGGLMDRLDSLVVVAPIAYALLNVVRAARLSAGRAWLGQPAARRPRPMSCSSTSDGCTLIVPSASSVVRQVICRPSQW